MSNQVKTLSGEAVNNKKPVSKFDHFRSGLVQKKSSIEKVLPAHITFEKFQSVVLTACMQNPDLLTAHRPSMMLACVKSATDGLLPDGRDAALVMFNSKVGKDDSGRDIWGKKVQYMPMYAGILKKVRQSKELSSVTAQVVYKNDHFEHNLGDENTIVHRIKDGDDRGAFHAAYCIAKLTDGTVMKEVMYFSDIEKVRKSSKAGSVSSNDLKYNKGAEVGDPKGIWKEWYDEMAKKTVFRRLAKWLPQSTDKDGNEIRLFADDDSMEIIEHSEESVTWDENGEIAAEAEQAPDLKKIAQDKKDADAAKAEPKQIENQTEATTASEGQKVVEQIRKVMAETNDHQSFYDAITTDFAADLEVLKASEPKSFELINNEIEARFKELSV